MLSEIVRQLGELNFEGNITPHHWFQHPDLKLPNGKVNLPAVVILAEIVFWHRPVVIMDEATGQVMDIRNRFEGEQFRRTFQAMGAKFGLTKRQARDACHFLQDRGAIKIDLLTIEHEGTRLNNVTAFTPVVEKVRELNGPDTLLRSGVGGGTPKRGRVYRPTAGGHTPERGTSIKRKKDKEITLCSSCSFVIASLFSFTPPEPRGRASKGLNRRTSYSSTPTRRAIRTWRRGKYSARSRTLWRSSFAHMPARWGA